MSEQDPTPTEMKTHAVLERAERGLSRAEKAVSWPERVKRWGIAYLCVAVTIIGFQDHQARTNQTHTLNGVSSLVHSHSDEINQIRQAVQNAQRSVQILLDCTEPQGNCAQRGATATRAAVVDLAHQQAASAWCAFHHPALNSQQVYQCSLMQVAHWGRQ